MIKNFYAIRETGQCVFHINLCSIELSIEKKKDKNQKDPNLISGFFAAVLTFADHVVGGDNEVHKLSLKNSNFFFIKKGQIHYIIETDLINQKMEEEDFFELLQQLANYIEDYVKDNDVDDSYMQISDDEYLCSQIKDLISQYMRKKILGSFTINGD